MVEGSDSRLGLDPASWSVSAKRPAYPRRAGPRPSLLEIAAIGGEGGKSSPPAASQGSRGGRHDPPATVRAAPDSSADVPPGLRRRAGRLRLGLAPEPRGRGRRRSPASEVVHPALDVGRAEPDR